MSCMQTARACPEHESCTVIVGVQDDVELWRSHMDSAVHPEHRINPDHPAQTVRGRKLIATPVCPKCEQHPAWRALTS